MFSLKLIIFRDTRLNLTMHSLYCSLLFNIFTVNLKYINYNKITLVHPNITADLCLLLVFFVHSSSMAKQENISELENVINPDPSTCEDSMEGRMDLVQVIVANQGFIAKLSSAILAQMAPQMLKQLSAVFQGQVDVRNPGVSQDQMGTQNQHHRII